MELTKSEMEIMDVLWASSVPLSRADLLERSEQKSWKDSSVHILLNGLLQKKAIREAGFVKRSKTYGQRGIFCYHHFLPQGEARHCGSGCSVAEAEGHHSGRTGEDGAASG